MSVFRSELSEEVFNLRYRHDGCETWQDLAKTIVHDVCHGLMKTDEMERLVQYISQMKCIPGGRYLYYAGRRKRFWNNCYLLRAEEDSREDWAEHSWKAESCLLTGGGIGTDYTVYRPSNIILKGTGGTASGPIPKMLMTNEIGRRVLQGGARRSAIYASLNWKHGDIEQFLRAKNWHEMPVRGTDYTVADLKNLDFDFNAPLDMTNISVNYDTKWLLDYYKTGDPGDVFMQNVSQALTTGEPGFSFNFFDKERETLRNACTEVSSEDDSDVCNLGSLNLSRIDDLNEFADIVNLMTKFLMCGSIRADVPYDKIALVREQNRRLGLGLMGVHEWLIQRGYKYEVTPELHHWLSVYRGVSDATSQRFSQTLGVSTPIANRAVAPTGTIGLLAGTTTGIEPVYAVAYKRRYLAEGQKRKYQYYVDHAAHQIIQKYGVSPDSIDTALSMSGDFERRIAFQADIQDYVDMAISSTINLPNAKTNWIDPKKFAKTLADYSPRLRGFTVYPDGARGGQPLTEVPYKEALESLGEEFDEYVEHNETCEGGVCGI